MPYRPTDIGAQLHTDKASAHQKIVDAYKTHRTREAAAEALGVKPATLTRWVRSLISAGFADPRGSATKAQDVDA